MKIKFVTRFGKVVQFEKKKKRIVQMPGESWFAAACRTYYPAKYRRSRELYRKEQGGSK